MNWKEQYEKKYNTSLGDIPINGVHLEYIYHLESKLTEKTKELTLTQGNMFGMEIKIKELESQLKEAREEIDEWKWKLNDASTTIWKEKKKREEAEAKLKAIEDSLLSDEEIREMSIFEHHLGNGLIEKRINYDWENGYKSANNLIKQKL